MTCRHDIRRDGHRGPASWFRRSALAGRRAFLERFEAALSRFRPDSELCRLNAAPGAAIAASPLLRTWPCRRRCGRPGGPAGSSTPRSPARSRLRATPQPPRPRSCPSASALAAAPPRRPAAADPAARWRLVTSTIGATRAAPARRPARHRRHRQGPGRRPPRPPARAGARRPPCARWAVDCGGDLRVCAPAGAPFEVDVRHPLTGETIDVLRLHAGGVATSGLDVRLWRTPDGRRATTSSTPRPASRHGPA